MTNTNELTDDEKLTEIAAAAGETPEAIASKIDRKLARQTADTEVRVNVETVRSAIIDDIHSDLEQADDSRTNAAPSPSQSNSDEQPSAPVAGVGNTDTDSADTDSRANTNAADAGARLNAADAEEVRQYAFQMGVAPEELSVSGPEALALIRSRANSDETAPTGGVSATAAARDPVDDGAADEEGDEAPAAGVSNADRENPHRVNVDPEDLVCACGYKADSPTQLSAHTQTAHSDSDLLTCNKCDYTTTSSRALESHTVHKHGEGYLGHGAGNVPGQTSASKSRLRRGGGIVDL